LFEVAASHDEVAEEAMTYDIRDYALDKLATYYHEADLYRMLPRKSWRSRVAQILYTMAERVEPARDVVFSD
jgi:hypothetical protein